MIITYTYILLLYQNFKTKRPLDELYGSEASGISRKEELLTDFIKRYKNE